VEEFLGLLICFVGYEFMGKLQTELNSVHPFIAPDWYSPTFGHSVVDVRGNILGKPSDQLIYSESLCNEYAWSMTKNKHRSVVSRVAYNGEHPGKYRVQLFTSSS
jgi:hypothetical protein